MKTVTIPWLADSLGQFAALPGNLEYRRSFMRHLLSEPLPAETSAHLASLPCFVRFVLEELDGPYRQDVWESVGDSPVWSKAIAAAGGLKDASGRRTQADDADVPLPLLRKLAGDPSFEARCRLLASPDPGIVLRFPQVGLPVTRWVLIPPDQGRLPPPEPRQSEKGSRSRRRKTASRLRPAVPLHSMSDFLARLSDKESSLRGTIFELPRARGREAGLYPHQQDSLDAIKAHLPAFNGVVHLPTGSGKTHIAMRFAAEFLAEGPHRKLLWASYPKQLIRQSMARIVELAAWFPKGTRIAWYDSWMLHEPNLLDQVDVLFIMRGQLGELMARATLTRPRDCPLRRALIEPLGKGGYEMTLVYDECHQVAARKLRGKWLKLTRAVTGPFETARTRFHVVGLSATPVPQSKAGRRFVSRTVFPVRAPVAPGLTPEWGLLTYHQVSNKELVDCSVLCPVNLHFQDLPRRPFEIPLDIIHKVTADEPVELPDRNRPSRAQVERFSSQFNRQVMSSGDVLGFLAERIGERLPQLGKTLVFVPTIDAANELGRLLGLRPQVSEDDVLVVHSRLDEVESEEGSETRADAPAVIEQFKARGHSTCVLINVGMLTQGFDDPAIRSIILARLTFSTNLFWQMIGRGTRGPRLGGTRNCHVIDPIRLGDMYDFLEGYRPRVDVDGYGKWDRHFTGGARLARGAVLAPQLPRVSIPPLLSEATGQVEMDLSAEMTSLLKSFLDGRRLDEEQLVLLATRVEAVQHGADWNCRPVTEDSDDQMIRWMHEAVAQLETRMDNTLHWVKLPLWRTERSNEINLGLFFQTLTEIEDGGLAP